VHPYLSQKLLDGTRLNKWDYVGDVSNRIIIGFFNNYFDATENNENKKIQNCKEICLMIGVKKFSIVTL
jgi:hypothetical protein